MFATMHEAHKLKKVQKCDATCQTQLLPHPKASTLGLNSRHKIGSSKFCPICFDHGELTLRASFHKGTVIADFVMAAAFQILL
jgi:hypothetical protein